MTPTHGEVGFIEVGTNLVVVVPVNCFFLFNPFQSIVFLFNLAMEMDNLAKVEQRIEEAEADLKDAKADLKDAKARLEGAEKPNDAEAISRWTGILADREARLKTLLARQERLETARERTSAVPPSISTHSATATATAIQPSTVFVVEGVLRFAKTRADCRWKVYKIAESTHAKTRIGVDDGIFYQGISNHLQFRLVFEEKWQAEDFYTAIKSIPREYRIRKREEDSLVAPDIDVELLPVLRAVWNGDLVRVEEDQYQQITGDKQPSPDFDPLSSSYVSAVTINDETRLRLLEREDSPMFFAQKPEKCHITRQADDRDNAGNPNNIVFMSRFLRQQLDAINSTEGIPMFYFRYVDHDPRSIRGLVNGRSAPVYETTIEIIFKTESAKSELTRYFKNPTDVSQERIRVTAFFPDPLQFRDFAESSAEITCRKWASYDRLLNG